MSGPFKMKYQRSPLDMFGGTKSSPARSWWNKMFGQNRTMESGEEGGTNISNVPQHGPEAHSGKGGDENWFGKTFGGNLSGSGGGNDQNPMDWFKRMFGGGGGGMF